jgi:hypothetical protein
MCNFNPDFAVGLVMRSSKAIQKRVSGYFLSEGIVIYFELKKCSESLLCEAFELRNRTSTAKSGFNTYAIRLLYTNIRASLKPYL